METRKDDDFKKDDDRDLNRDPITGEPGSHPVGTGLGSAGGAAAGAAIGAAGGPVGMAVGGVIGAIVGAAAGHGIAETIDPTEEDAYWRENFRNEPYYSEGSEFADYQPAYRLGYLNYPSYVGRTYEEAEAELERDWDQHRGESRLGWEEAKPAARAGWQRVEQRYAEGQSHRTAVDDPVAGTTLPADDEREANSGPLP